MSKLSALNHTQKCQDILQSITISVQHSGVNYGKRPTFWNSAWITCMLLQNSHAPGFDETWSFKNSESMCFVVRDVSIFRNLHVLNVWPHVLHAPGSTSPLTYIIIYPTLRPYLIIHNTQKIDYQSTLFLLLSWPTFPLSGKWFFRLNYELYFSF